MNRIVRANIVISICTCLLLCISNNSIANNQALNIDSLKQSLNNNRNTLETAKSYANMAKIDLENGRYIEGIKLAELSNAYINKEKDPETYILNLTTLGNGYSRIGNYPKGLQYLQQALDLTEKVDDKKTTAMLYLYIGSIHSEGINKDYAINYFKKSEQLALQINDSALLTNAKIYIANDCYYNKKYKEAIEMYEQACTLSKLINNKRSEAATLGNLGNIYDDLLEYEKALDYQFLAVKIFESESDNQGLTICYYTIGTNYYATKNYPKSLEYYNKALKIALDMNSWEDLIQIYFGLSRTYEAINDIDNAYKNFKLYTSYNDSIYNEGNTKKLTEMELNYQFQIKENEQQLIQKNKEEIARETLKKQKIISTVSIAGIGLLLILIVVVYRNSLARKKSNKKLRQLNNEVILKNNIIGEKNREITDSINYAKRIQTSFLTSEKYIAQLIPEYFIFFKPRDIVSGDFYWVAQKNNSLYVCTADCTGHGIPGAFMSLIGMSILNEIIHSKDALMHTEEILNELRRIVILALNPIGATTEGNDGMDAVFCRFDFQRMELEYSAANNSFYIVRKGELIELKPDKMPVGKYVQDDKPFTRNLFKLEKGDCVYTFTDGYVDQFGGPNEKKYKNVQFKKLLLSIYEQPMHKQQELIEDTLNKWKGAIDQVDDICVMGIRV